jgi:hypothetical protein
VITVSTKSLKDQLNLAYDAKRKKKAQLNNFDSLWDLKEKALLEGKSSIDVPRTWMDELDGALKQQAASKN